MRSKLKEIFFHEPLTPFQSFLALILITSIATSIVSCSAEIEIKNYFKNEIKGLSDRISFLEEDLILIKIKKLEIEDVSEFKRLFESHTHRYYDGKIFK